MGPHEPLLGCLSGHPPSPAPPTLLSSHGYKVCLYFTSLVLFHLSRGAEQRASGRGTSNTRSDLRRRIRAGRRGCLSSRKGL